MRFKPTLLSAVLAAASLAAPAQTPLPALPAEPTGAPGGTSLAGQGGMVIDFDEGSSLSRVLRILASEAGLNYLEPEISPEETVAFTLRGMSPRDAFFRLAKSRGFTVREHDGLVELIRSDKKSSSESQIRVYTLQHVDARLVISSVASFLGIRELRAPSRTSPAFPEPATSAASSTMGSSAGGFSTGQTGMGGSSTGSSNLPSEGRFIPGLPMDAPLWSGGHEASAQSSIYLDRTTNSLVVRASEKQHEEAARFIQTLDVREPQIEITARVIEIDVGKLHELGLDWSFGYSNKSGRLSASTRIQSGSLTATGAFNDAGSAAQAILAGWQVQALLRASQENDRTSLVTDARVVTRSGIPAVVNNMVQEFIEVFTSTGSTLVNANAGVSAVPANSVQSGTQVFQTGVVLDVLPRVLEDGRIDLNINPTVLTRIGQTTGATGQKLPIIVRRSTTTSVMVRDGATVGIGGLMQMDDARTRNQVPVLGGIPVVGALFRSSSDQRRKRNLVILVTPRLLKDEAFLSAPTLPEARSATEEAGNQLLNPAPWVSGKQK